MTTNPIQDTSSRIVRATGIIMLITVVAKLFGFVEKLVLAYLFGTGPEIDAYLVAFSAPFMIFIIVREIVEPSLLPTLMDYRNNAGESESWRLLSAVTNVAIGVLFVVTIAGVLAAPQLVAVLAPGFDDQRHELAVQMLRVVFPASLFLGLSAVGYITLNSYKRFAVPALGDLVFKAVPVFVLLLSSRVLGIMAMCVGVVAAAISRLLVYGVALWGHRDHFHTTFRLNTPAGRKMGRLMLPLACGIAFSQLSAIIDNMFASGLQTGSVSALAYARKLVDMPVLIIPYSLGIVLFPFFSELAVARDTNGLWRMFVHATKLITVVFVPLAVATVVLREQVVQIVLERGAFDAQSTRLTSSALLYYGAALYTFAFEAILVQFYFSMSDTKTPIVVGVSCVILNIVLTLLLIHSLQHRGIALALALSKTVKVVILYCLLGRRIAAARLSEPIGFFFKIIAAAAVMGLGMLLLDDRISSTGLDGGSGQLAAMGLLVATGFAVYVGGLAVMRDPDVRGYTAYAAAWLRSALRRS